MLAVSATRQYGEPPVERHDDEWLYDTCRCGARKRKTSDMCRGCKAALLTEADRREKMKSTVRHAMATMRELQKWDRDEGDAPSVEISFIAPFGCDLLEVLWEVKAEVCGT